MVVVVVVVVAVVVLMSSIFAIAAGPGAVPVEVAAGGLRASSGGIINIQLIR